MKIPFLNRGAGLKGEKGFTLLEILISLALTAILMIGIYGLYQTLTRRAECQDNLLNAQQSLRAVVEIMSKELTLAGHRVDTGVAVFKTMLPTRMAFRYKNPQENGTFLDTLVEYEFTGTVLKKGVCTGGLNCDLPTDTSTPARHNVLENIPANGVTFKYYDHNNIVTADVSKVRYVEVSLKTEIDKGDAVKAARCARTSGSVVNVGTKLYLRNMGLQGDAGDTIGPTLPTGLEVREAGFGAGTAESPTRTRGACGKLALSWDIPTGDENRDLSYYLVSYIDQNGGGTERVFKVDRTSLSQIVVGGTSKYYYEMSPVVKAVAADGSTVEKPGIAAYKSDGTANTKTYKIFLKAYDTSNNPNPEALPTNFSAATYSAQASSTADTKTLANSRGEDTFGSGDNDTTINAKKPDPVKNLVYDSTATESAVKLTWSYDFANNPGIVGFRVYRSEHPFTDYNNAYPMDPPGVLSVDGSSGSMMLVAAESNDVLPETLKGNTSALLGPTATSFTDTSLVGCKPYYYAVIPVNCDDSLIPNNTGTDGVDIMAIAADYKEAYASPSDTTIPGKPSITTKAGWKRVFLGIDASPDSDPAPDYSHVKVYVNQPPILTDAITGEPYTGVCADADYPVVDTTLTSPTYGAISNGVPIPGTDTTEHGKYLEPNATSHTHTYMCLTAACTNPAPAIPELMNKASYCYKAVAYDRCGNPSEVTTEAKTPATLCDDDPLGAPGGAGGWPVEPLKVYGCSATTGLKAEWKSVNSLYPGGYFDTSLYYVRIKAGGTADFSHASELPKNPDFAGGVLYNNFYVDPYSAGTLMNSGNITTNIQNGEYYTLGVSVSDCAYDNGKTSDTYSVWAVREGISLGVIDRDVQCPGAVASCAPDHSTGEPNEDPQHREILTGVTVGANNITTPDESYSHGSVTFFLYNASGGEMKITGLSDLRWQNTNAKLTGVTIGGGKTSGTVPALTTTVAVNPTPLTYTAANPYNRQVGGITLTSNAIPAGTHYVPITFTFSSVSASAPALVDATLLPDNMVSAGAWVDQTASTITASSINDLNDGTYARSTSASATMKISTANDPGYVGGTISSVDIWVKAMPITTGTLNWYPDGVTTLPTAVTLTPSTTISITGCKIVSGSKNVTSCDATSMTGLTSGMPVTNANIASGTTASFPTTTLITASTTLSAGITNTVTTIPVTSTVGFPSSGTIKIDSELIAYTGITATSFTGATRVNPGRAAHTNGATVTYILSSSATSIPVDSVTGFAASGSVLIESEWVTYTGISGTTFTGVTRGGGSSAVSHNGGVGVTGFVLSANATGSATNQTIVATSSATFKDYVKSFTTRPTGGAWTVADVDNLNVVVVNGSGTDIRVAEVWAVVHYYPAATPKPVDMREEYLKIKLTVSNLTTDSIDCPAYLTLNQTVGSITVPRGPDITTVQQNKPTTSDAVSVPGTNSDVTLIAPEVAALRGVRITAELSGGTYDSDAGQYVPIASAKVYYKVTNTATLNAPTSGYSSVDMKQWDGTDYLDPCSGFVSGSCSATIPAAADSTVDSYIWYFVVVEDAEGNFSRAPDPVLLSVGGADFTNTYVYKQSKFNPCDPENIPAVPTNVTHAVTLDGNPAVTTDKIKLTWNAVTTYHDNVTVPTGAGGDEISYTIYRQDRLNHGFAPTSGITCAAASCTYDDLNLDVPNNDYIYYVTATNKCKVLADCNTISDASIKAACKLVPPPYESSASSIMKECSLSLKPYVYDATTPNNSVITNTSFDVTTGTPVEYNVKIDYCPNAFDGAGLGGVDVGMKYTPFAYEDAPPQDGIPDGGSIDDDAHSVLEVPQVVDNAIEDSGQYQMLSYDTINSMYVPYTVYLTADFSVDDATHLYVGPNGAVVKLIGDYNGVTTDPANISKFYINPDFCSTTPKAPTYFDIVTNSYVEGINIITSNYPSDKDGLGNVTLEWVAPSQNTDGSNLISPDFGGYNFYRNGVLKTTIAAGTPGQTVTYNTSEAATAGGTDIYYEVEAYDTCSSPAANKSVKAKTPLIAPLNTNVIIDSCGMANDAVNPVLTLPAAGPVTISPAPLSDTYGSANSANGYSVTLNWTPAQGWANTYTVSRSLNGGAWSDIGACTVTCPTTVGASCTSPLTCTTDVAAETSGDIVKYKVTATSTKCSTALSNTSGEVTVTKDVCVAPTTVTSFKFSHIDKAHGANPPLPLSEDNLNSIALSWVKPATAIDFDLTGYDVIRYVSTDSTWGNGDDSQATISVAPATTLSYAEVVAPAYNNKYMKYGIKAKDECSLSGPESQTNTILVGACTLTPDAPVSVWYTHSDGFDNDPAQPRDTDTNNKVDLQWNASASSDGVYYEIAYSTDNGMADAWDSHIVFTSAVGATSKTGIDMSSIVTLGTPLYFAVRSVDYCGLKSGWTSTGLYLKKDSCDNAPALSVSNNLAYNYLDASGNNAYQTPKPTDATAADEVNLSWSGSGDGDFQNYVVRYSETGAGAGSDYTAFVTSMVGSSATVGLGDTAGDDFKTMYFSVEEVDYCLRTTQTDWTSWILKDTCDASPAQVQNFAYTHSDSKPHATPVDDNGGYQGIAGTPVNTTGSVAFSWSAPAINPNDVWGYTIFVSYKNAGVWGAWQGIGSAVRATHPAGALPTAATIAMAAADSLKEMKFAIKATDYCYSDSVMSAETTAIMKDSCDVDPAAPGAVTYTHSDNVANGGTYDDNGGPGEPGQVQLSWTAPAGTENSDVTGYNAYIRYNSGVWSIIAGSPFTGTSVAINTETTPSNDGKYMDFAIESYDYCGRVSTKTVTATQLLKNSCDAAPNAPTGVLFLHSDGTANNPPRDDDNAAPKVTVKWTDSTSADATTGYRVYKRENAGGWTEVTVTPVAPGTGQLDVDTSGFGNFNYMDFSVEAVDYCKISSAKAATTVLMKNSCDASPANAPQLANATLFDHGDGGGNSNPPKDDDGSGKIKLKWAAPAATPGDFVGYKVFYSTSSGGPWTDVTNLITGAVVNSGVGGANGYAYYTTDTAAEVTLASLPSAPAAGTTMYFAVAAADYCLKYGPMLVSPKLIKDSCLNNPGLPGAVSLAHSDGVSGASPPRDTRNDNTIDVNWGLSASTDDVSYEVAWSKDNATWYVLTSTAIAATSVANQDINAAATDPAADDKVYVGVRSVDYCNKKSNYVAVQSGGNPYYMVNDSCLAIPGAPSNPAYNYGDGYNASPNPKDDDDSLLTPAVTNDSSNVLLQWTASANAATNDWSGYKIYYSSVNNTTPMATNYTANVTSPVLTNSLIASGTTATVNVGGVGANTSMYFSVAAVDYCYREAQVATGTSKLLKNTCDAVPAAPNSIWFTHVDTNVGAGWAGSNTPPKDTTSANRIDVQWNLSTDTDDVYYEVGWATSDLGVSGAWSTVGGSPTAVGATTLTNINTAPMGVNQYDKIYFAVRGKDYCGRPGSWKTTAGYLMKDTCDADPAVPANIRYAHTNKVNDASVNPNRLDTAADGTVTIAWDASTADTVTYKIYRNVNGTGFNYYTSVSAPTLSYTDPNANTTDYNKYAYTVEAVDYCGRVSGQSGATSTIMKKSCDAAPGGLTGFAFNHSDGYNVTPKDGTKVGDPLGADMVSLKWNAPGAPNDIVSYNIYYWTGVWSNLSNTTSNPYNFTISGFANFYNLYFDIAAVDFCGLTGDPWATAWVGYLKNNTCDAPPAVPTNVGYTHTKKASDASVNPNRLDTAADGTVTIGWSASTADTVTYRIYRSVNSGPYNYLTFVNAPTVSYTDPNANTTDYNTYAYTVEAVDYCGRVSGQSATTSTIMKKSCDAAPQPASVGFTHADTNVPAGWAGNHTPPLDLSATNTANFGWSANGHTDNVTYQYGWATSDLGGAGAWTSLGTTPVGATSVSNVAGINPGAYTTIYGAVRGTDFCNLTSSWVSTGVTYLRQDTCDADPAVPANIRYTHTNKANDASVNPNRLDTAADGTVTIAWDASTADTVTYKIYRNVNGAGFIYYTSVSAPTLSYTDPNANTTDYNKYAYTVEAEDYCGRVSGQSAATSTIMKKSCDAAPGGLTGFAFNHSDGYNVTPRDGTKAGDPLGADMVSLIWDAPGAPNDIVSYNIYYWTGSWSYLRNTTSNPDNFSISLFANFYNLYFRIAAVDFCGLTANPLDTALIGTLVNNTCDADPAVPANIRYTHTNKVNDASVNPNRLDTAADGTVTIAWDASTADTVTYRIYRSVNSGPYNYLTFVNAPTVSYTDPNASTTDYNKYAYQVDAVDYCGRASALSASTSTIMKKSCDAAPQPASVAFTHSDGYMTYGTPRDVTAGDTVDFGWSNNGHTDSVTYQYGWATSIAGPWTPLGNTAIGATSVANVTINPAYGTRIYGAVRGTDFCGLTSAWVSTGATYLMKDTCDEAPDVWTSGTTTAASACGGGTYTGVATETVWAEDPISAQNAVDVVEFYHYNGTLDYTTTNYLGMSNKSGACLNGTCNWSNAYTLTVTPVTSCTYSWGWYYWTKAKDYCGRTGTNFNQW